MGAYSPSGVLPYLLLLYSSVDRLNPVTQRGLKFGNGLVVVLQLSDVAELDIWNRDGRVSPYVIANLWENRLAERCSETSRGAFNHLGDLGGELLQIIPKLVLHLNRT